MLFAQVTFTGLCFVYRRTIVFYCCFVLLFNLESFVLPIELRIRDTIVLRYTKHQPLYKKWFVCIIKYCTENSDNISLTGMSKSKLFEQLEEKVSEIGGDVLEIGAGTGRSLELLRLPEGSSLVVVDYNPFMEKPFRESLAKAPDIKLKDYLVQSAADMTNIPDNTFAAVFLSDVLCSLEVELVRKVLNEIKRVLKPGGCFFFLEHVSDEPGTWRRTFQRFVASQTGIWPRLFDGCHCDRETGRYIQETGFESVSLNHTSISVAKTNNPIKDQLTLMFSYFFTTFIIGHAKK